MEEKAEEKSVPCACARVFLFSKQYNPESEAMKRLIINRVVNTYQNDSL